MIKSSKEKETFMTKMSFVKEMELLAKNTVKGINYFSNVVKQKFEIGNDFKAVSYIVYDKNFEPYLLLPSLDYYNYDNKASTQIDFSVYAIREDDQSKVIENIGHIYTSRYGKIFKMKIEDKVKKDFSTEAKKGFGGLKPYKEEMLKAMKKNEFKKRQQARKNRHDELDFLEIINRDYISVGLGKEMYSLFEYNSFINGAIKMKGVAVPLNDRFINRTNLYRFYEGRGIDLNRQNGLMQKDFKPGNMKNYASRIATYSKDGIIIKVVFPEFTKDLIMDYIKKTPSKSKTSLITDIREL